MVKINAVFTRNTTKPMRTWTNQDFFNAIYDSVGGKTGLYNKVKIAHNTWAYMSSRNYAVIRFHDTDILTYYRFSNRWCVDIQTGGYVTATTKQRINQFTPQSIRVSQTNFVWYLAQGHHLFGDYALLYPYEETYFKYVDYVPVVF